MSVKLSFADRLLEVVVPTPFQALAAVFISFAALVAAQSQSIIKSLGISSAQLTASGDEFHTRFDAILRSPVASQAALITFWATVGLIAYLVCWGAYNLLIEARNEVTLNTAYTNRGHWRGARETLALKSLCALGLALMLWSLGYGASFWLAISGRFLDQLSTGSILAAALAVVGLAAQLYFVFAFVLLTFTPWYRVQTFTDV